jgi:CRISPR-associated endonuclease/helicase Cas3
MDYPVPLAGAASRDDTLLRLLAGNDFAADDYRQRHGRPAPNLLRQAFMTAGTAFKSIDAPTRGVIVPFASEGKELVADLCNSVHPEKEFGLLRRSQQYSVNLFPFVFDSLVEAGAISEISAGAGIYYLHENHYDNVFGLSDAPVSPVEPIDA